MFLFKCGYAGNNFFSFCLSGNIFMSSLFLKDIFTCCIILLGLLFPVISLKMPFHCIDVSFVSVWKPVLNFNVLLLLCFQDFFLCLLFPDFSGICLGMNFFIFNLPWVHNTFYLHSLNFHKLGKSQPLPLKYCFCLYIFPFVTPVTCILIIFMVSNMSLILSSVLSIHAFLLLQHRLFLLTYF